MSNFEKALNEVLKDEGGYVKDPLDNGGETFKGISRRYFPKWEGWDIVDVNHFDERLDDLVSKFYKHYFWDTLKLDDVQSPFIAEMLFNVGINQGKKVVTKKVQRILGVSVDGIIGPKTISALNSVDEGKFVFQFILETIDLYVHIVNTHTNQRKFLLGWLNRAMRLYHKYLREG